VPHRWAAASQ